MKIVRHKQTHVVYYIFPDGEPVSLTNKLETPSVRAHDMNDTEHEVIDAPAPEFFCGACMAFDGAWVIVDQASYNEAFLQYATYVGGGIVENVQRRLDDFAKTKNYDGILSACSYASSTNPTFKAEADYCVSSRDATWAKMYEIMGEFESGARPLPDWAEVEAELPPLVWP